MLEFAEAQYTDRKTLFVEVILPLAISKNYTYRVPFELNDAVAIGKRVVVQFGKSKLYTAVIAAITGHAPEKYEAKYLLDVLDDRPVVTERQLQFWKWLAEYYMCNDGEVMNAALPSALKLASETKIALNKPIDRKIFYRAKRLYFFASVKRSLSRVIVYNSGGKGLFIN